jgi:hypothetical protein
VPEAHWCATLPFVLLALLLLAAQPARPPAHLVVPEKLRKEREAEAAPPAPILGDAALADALGPPKAEPGAWAEYAVRTRGEPDVRVRISILPPLLADGRYWLEADSVGSEGMPYAVKLRAKQDPADPRNVDKLYLYVAGQAPIEAPLDQLPPAAPPTRKMGKVVRGAPERVQVKAGVFEKAEPLRVGEVRIWRSSSVPIWGLVKSQSRRQTVELMAFGRTGAHSTFPPGFADEQNQGNGSESMK